MRLYPLSHLTSTDELSQTLSQNQSINACGKQLRKDTQREPLASTYMRTPEHMRTPSQVHILPLTSINTTAPKKKRITNKNEQDPDARGDKFSSRAWINKCDIRPLIGASQDMTAESESIC